MLFLPVGTGISAAALVDGRPVHPSAYAGEAGHLVVDPGGRPCACGGRGCLEALASASALATAYTERSGRGGRRPGDRTRGPHLDPRPRPRGHRRRPVRGRRPPARPAAHRSGAAPHLPEAPRGRPSVARRRRPLSAVAGKVHRVAVPGTAPRRVVGPPEYVQYKRRPFALRGLPSALRAWGDPMHRTPRPGKPFRPQHLAPA
ncbi:ROK family protein [Streptomyces sp. NBC_00249]|uniref:ROK family protein n=1 Tax=Streptomyces sp. NBC_00249 TaxID=2975690 RepID=UPI00224C9C57|nr:ROK family protein [Streptomyces sp. NBC_00249]MCX5192860.1 ROK family protein [Streptomyces sp. NBC_00249]